MAKTTDDGMPAVPVASGDPAVIFCTPGSTGSYKKVCHSHGDLFDTFKNYGRGVLGLGAQDRLFCTSKGYFIYSFKCMILGLAGGGGVILPPSHPTPEKVERLIRDFNPAYIFSVPTIYSRMLQAAIDRSAFASVKYFIFAGEPLPQNVYDLWYERYNRKILDGIGTTESLCFVISNSLSS
jgi:acyl-coenzyme A synthetase/AMP-(fatty) acid ligase